MQEHHFSQPLSFSSYYTDVFSFNSFALNLDLKPDPGMTGSGPACLSFFVADMTSTFYHLPRIDEKTWFEGDPVVINTINLEQFDAQDEDYHKAEINQVNNDEEHIEDIPLAINIYVGNEENEQHEETVQQNVFDQEEVDTPKERIVLESLDIIGESSHDDGILESVRNF